MPNIDKDDSIAANAPASEPFTPQVDTYVERTTRSWGSRIGSSLKGILVGIVLVLAAIVGIFWNESRAVATADALAEGRGLVAEVPADAVNPANEGRLVLVTGKVANPDTLADPVFGISAEGVRLVRKVEMYQWVEHSRSETQKKLGGGEETVTTYTYTTEWSTDTVDHTRFKHPDGHANPARSVEPKVFATNAARLGAFRLSADQAGATAAAKPLPVPPGREFAIRNALATQKFVHTAEGKVIVGADPARPAVGDIRVSFELAPLGEATIVARQSRDGFAPYVTSNGRELSMIREGRLTAEQVFADAAASNTIITWVFRVVGLLAMAIGFSLVLAPLKVVADVVPFIGSIVGMGTGLAALILTVAVGTLTIALAWLAARPLLSLGLIAVAVLAVIGLVVLRRKPAVPTPA